MVLHEQNAAMGLTNKVVSKWAKKVLLAFPITGRKGEVIGNPIRQSLTELPPPSERIKKQAPFRILVVGGSLGAKAINETVPKAFADMLSEIELTHQTGKTTFAETKATYEQMGLLDKVNLLEYIDDMDSAYANADLVIGRAGALTVSEIASVGLPAIFIPLPHAVDNHQFLNANFLAETEAAIIIEQKDLTPEKLQQTVKGLLNTDSLLAMAEKAKKQSHEKALAMIIKRIKELL